MRLFRLIIYVENKENLTYIASTTTTTTKKTGIPAQPALLFHAATNTSLPACRRLLFPLLHACTRAGKYFADTHTKKHNEKLVLICQPSLYSQPPGPGPEALDFSRRLPWGRKVEDKKEQGF